MSSSCWQASSELIISHYPVLMQAHSDARAYGTYEYVWQWLEKKTQICGNLSGEHNDAREDNLADGRVHSPIPQWLHEPARSSTGECTVPRPASAAVHKTEQKGSGNETWMAKEARRASPYWATVFSSSLGTRKLDVATNLSRLVIYVACGPCSGEFEVVSFPVSSLHFPQDSVLLLFLPSTPFKSEQLANGRQMRRGKASWAVPWLKAR